jgi:hypothetical protein
MFTSVPGFGWLKPRKAQEAGLPRWDRAFYLWIDGVGGYLVCLNNRITLGQATPDAIVDVPILADVSRMHAMLARDSEGYLLHALRPAKVNGKAVDKTLLRNGDRIKLGGSCELHFQQPVPVSTSARLDVMSGHRLRLAVDGVLLMADTLVLGCGGQAHVQVADAKLPMILYRNKDGLALRTDAAVTINGKSVSKRGQLGPGDHVVSEEFSLAVEAVGTDQ